MSDAPQRYPLQWPFGQPRRPERNRITGKFGTASKQHSQTWLSRKDITLAQALKRLQDELDRWGGVTSTVLSTDVALRQDGQPRSGQAAPKDPGACLYFRMNNKPHALPCDRYTKVEQNIAAIAAHIEATRAIERYGVADMQQMYAGFAALPSPEQALMPHWRTVLECEDASTFAQVQLAYRRRASATHPDKNRDRAVAAAIEFDLVQRAWTIAQQELKS